MVVLGASEQCIFSYRPRLPRKCFIARGPVFVCLDHLQHTSDDDDTDCRRRAEQHQRSHLFRCLALEKYRRAVKFELSYRPGRTREKLREVVGPDQTQDHRGEEGVVWRSTQRPRIADPQCVADDQTRLVVLRPPSGVRQQDVCGRLVPLPHQSDEDLAGVPACSKVDQVLLRKLAQDAYRANVSSGLLQNY